MVASLEFLTYREYSDFILDKFKMIEPIYNAIDFAYFEGLSIALVFDAYIYETDQLVSHTIRRETWVFSLSQILKTCEEKEDYEFCEIIYTLIKELEEECL